MGLYEAGFFLPHQPNNSTPNEILLSTWSVS